MLFNEPKLLKCSATAWRGIRRDGFSALQRAEIAEIDSAGYCVHHLDRVSVLFNEPKLLKSTRGRIRHAARCCFSALQRAEIAEIDRRSGIPFRYLSFSALQRAEIAEIELFGTVAAPECSFSALQRAEIAEIIRDEQQRRTLSSFSALQRAEIAEIGPPSALHSIPDSVSVLFNEPKLLKCGVAGGVGGAVRVSVLFNEPKLLKYNPDVVSDAFPMCFSALQRAEIAEMRRGLPAARGFGGFSALQRAEIAEISSPPVTQVLRS